MLPSWRWTVFITIVQSPERQRGQRMRLAVRMLDRAGMVQALALLWQDYRLAAMEVTQLEIPGLEAFLPPEAAEKRAQDLLVNENRVELLETLYELDGRDDPSHPHHHTYTGLMVAFDQALGRSITDLLLSTKGFQPKWLTGSFDPDAFVCEPEARA